MLNTSTANANSISDGISVILLSYHTTSYVLCRTLDHIVCQTLAPTEILLVDRNEPQSAYSQSLLEDLQQYPEIRLISCPGLSEGAARNAAMQKASGAYLAFSDGTEAWHPDKLAHLHQCLRKHPTACAAVCNGVRIGTDKTSRFTKLPGTSMEDLLFSGCFDTPSAVLYRASAVHEAGGFDPALSLCQDPDLLTRLQATQEIVLLEENLFTQELSPMSSEAQYQGFRALFYKQYEQVAASRTLAWSYHIFLMHLAAHSAMWMEMFLHGVLAFATRPVRSLLTMSHALTKVANALYRHLVLQNLLRIKTAGLHQRIRRLHKPDSRKNARELREVPLAPEVPAQDLEGRNVILQYAFQRRLQNVCLRNISTIREGTFAGCQSLTRIVIPAHVRAIEAHAFHGCTSLTTVVIEEGSLLTHIGAYAFADCSALTSLVLPSTVNEMDAYAFAGCACLTELRFRYHQQDGYVVRPEFPAALAKLSTGIFAGCEQLQQVLLSEQNDVFRIGANALANCRNLSRFVLSGRIQFIGDYAFAHCVKLREVAIPYMDAVQYLGRGAFLQCQSLHYVQIPYALTDIQRYTYYGCSGLKHVRIPTTVKMIDAYAFRGCSELTSVEMQRSTTKYLPSTFERTVTFTNDSEVRYT